MTEWELGTSSSREQILPPTQISKHPWTSESKCFSNRILVNASSSNNIQRWMCSNTEATIPSSFPVLHSVNHNEMLVLEFAQYLLFFTCFVNTYNFQKFIFIAYVSFLKSQINLYHCFQQLLITACLKTILFFVLTCKMQNTHSFKRRLRRYVCSLTSRWAFDSIWKSLQ
jgi:hypothetical protein